MMMNLKKDFTLTFFDHRLFPMPAFGGLFSFKISPLGEISYDTRKNGIAAFLDYAEFSRDHKSLSCTAFVKDIFFNLF